MFLILLKFTTSMGFLDFGIC